MASLSDAKSVLTSLGPLTFACRVWQQIEEDYIFVWAAALAYAWLFAIFPFLIFLLTLIPHLPARVHTSADRAVRTVVKDMLGNAADTVIQNISDVMDHPHAGLLSAGLLIALWVAAGGMAMTMSAFDLCYEIKKGRSFINRRMVAIMLTIGVCILMLLVFCLITVGNGVQAWLSTEKYISYELRVSLNIFRYGLAVCMMLAILTLLYRFAPSSKQRFSLFSPGALFTIIVWILLDAIFRIYIDRFARYQVTYGTVGGVAIMLLLFYIDAAVLLIGAEINSEIDFAKLGKADEKPKIVPSDPNSGK